MTVDLEELYKSHGPMVLRRCRRLLRDEAKAVDAMHDVFVEILRRKDTLQLSSPVGLLLTTATHVCLNRLRTIRRKPEDPEGGVLFQIATLASDPDAESRTLAGRILDRIFAGQPESSRLIAVLHYVDRLTLEEVAGEVGLSVSGVRKRLRVIKDRLPAGTGDA